MKSKRNLFISQISMDKIENAPNETKLIGNAIFLFPNEVRWKTGENFLKVRDPNM